MTTTLYRAGCIVAHQDGQHRIEILPTELAGLDDDGARACVGYSLIELARTGTTTVFTGGRRGRGSPTPHASRSTG